MNRLNQNGNQATPLAVRIARSIRFRGEPLAEKISRAYERRSDIKSQTGAHDKAILLLGKAKQFASDEKRKSHILHKLGLEVDMFAEMYAERHETQAVELRREFDRARTNCPGREDFDYPYQFPGAPGVVDINALSGRLEGSEPLLSAAINWIRAGYYRMHYASDLEGKDNIAEAIIQLEKAVTDYGKGISICSTNLGLPQNFHLTSHLPPTNKPFIITVARAKSDYGAALKKLRALSFPSVQKKADIPV